MGKMNFKTILKKAYRLFHSQGVEKLVLPFVFSKKRIQIASEISTKDINPVSGPRIWFHAASAGELESLWPLIVLAGSPGASSPSNEIIVTLLSESGWGALERLKQKLQEIEAKVVFLGYSPWEGGWGNSLDQIRPTFFVTVKYEAWPDLWVSLQERNIPLVIIGARARKSLRIAKRITELLAELPQLLLFPCDPGDVNDLKQLFPKAFLEVVNEPRWERVFDRSKMGAPRARELTQVCKLHPRPWGVIGNAWLEDLKFLLPVLKEFQGTIWIVPHHLKTENIRKIRQFLAANGIDSVLTQGTAGDDLAIPTSAILVNEMGFLSELYSSADWAFVGGGFGAGIHSTIEPAIYGIPIAIGPNGSGKFSEVNQLQRSGQLSLLRNTPDLLEWIKEVSLDSHPELGQTALRPNKVQQNKQRWKREAESRCGGASQILYSLFQGNK
ncbi:MAG: glycosyltransferase N-terminal domain-containing protein [Bdellovibrionia bacterium]